MTLASQGLSYYILFRFGSDSRGHHWEMGPGWLRRPLASLTLLDFPLCGHSDLGREGCASLLQGKNKSYLWCLEQAMPIGHCCNS